jgi:hypothetical protein
MAVTYPVAMHIMGGLGNQLFQIFTGLSYAIENGRPIQFPYTEVVSESPRRLSYWSTFLKSIVHLTTTIDIYKYKRYFVKEFEYVHIPVFNHTVCLQGYFQSYKYFEKYFDTICKIIKLDDQKAIIKSDYKDTLFNVVDGMETISLHFRLGDYINQQGKHPVMSISYYKNALSQFDKSKSYRVLYFCEAADNDIVSKSIQILQDEFKNMEFVKVPDSIEDWKQMLIMANCTHNIIANSSFSWWGAHFNTNSSKKVCYPSKWFGPEYSNLNTKDLCPTSWNYVSLE